MLHCIAFACRELCAMRAAINNNEYGSCSAAHTGRQCLALSMCLAFTASASPKVGLYLSASLCKVMFREPMSNLVFHSVQAIQVCVTYSTPMCLLQGFYVALVYHSVSITYGGDTSIQKEASWIANWVSLVQQVQKSGACDVCVLMLSGLCLSMLKLSHCPVHALMLSGLCLSVPKSSACQVCALTRSGLCCSVLG